MKNEKRDFEKALIFAVLFATLACVSIGTVSAAQTHYVNPGESIQTAVDNANAGDTIIVKAGTYTESIAVYKQLTIQSETGADSTIVHAADSHIFNITADYVSIIGFTIEDASFDFGILLSDVNDCNISNNIVSGNYQGIYLSKSNQNTIFNNTAFSNENNGIYLVESSGNKIIGNDASNSVNYHGISVSSSNNNEIRNNTANSNHYQGIILWASNENTIANNTAKNNGENGIYLEDSNDNRIIGNDASNSVNYNGISIGSSNNNEIRDNIANYNHEQGIGLWTSSDNNTIANNTAKYDGNNGIYLEDSNGNRIIGNDASNSVNYHGISVSSSNNNEIRNNTANSNHYQGIGLWASNENTIANNMAKNNGENGIYLTNTNNNEIYLNNFIDNANNAYSTESTNVWNSSSLITYTYNGNTYTNYMGNYWGDYTGTDGNGDGLGDSPYSIDTDKDDYPLMQQWEFYFAQPTEFRVHNINTGKHFYTIQAAIDDSATNEGDTITVDTGTYNENVEVTKSLTIRSTSGNPADTIVQAANTSDHVFRVTSDYVNITGFTVTGATGDYKGGIYLYKVEHCNIADNNVSSNYRGIYLYSSSNYNSLANNTANFNKYGIYLYSSSNNTLTNNTANSNNLDGIRLYYHSDYNILANNIANSNKEAGILCWTSSANIMTYNNVNLNDYGIWLYNYSTENIVANNTAKNNENRGICIKRSNNNEIYLNNFIDNANNVYSNESTNVWNLPSLITYTYNGNTYTNNMGNYWGDYTGTDGNGDGLGDSPYSIDTDKDDYPLMQEWENYFAQPTEFRVHNINTGKDFNTIQAAIDDSATKEGDTITVDLGTYNENVEVTKSLTIRSTSGNPADTIVQAANTSDHVFEVTADYVNISGFTVKGETMINTAGIYLYKVEHGNISCNNARNNYYGIWLQWSSYNILMNNTANLNNGGVGLYSSSNYNTLTDNTAFNNTRDGIYLLVSSNNSFTNNTANSNTHRGIALHYSCNNSFTSNTASNNGDGFLLYSSSDNTLLNNTANSNDNGIYLLSSSTNNNRIYNNYFNNTINAGDDGNNTWNITKTVGTNIIGGPYIGGNYWSDYAGEDLNGDGLGDTQIPYIPSGNIEYGGDWLPLVKASASSVFDTGAGTYPSIQGTHEGEIIPSCDIEVSKMYTYSCTGTGGHAKSIEIYENDTLKASGNWTGYQEDWQNITITPAVTLKAGWEYRYVIETGSYPQIIHVQEYQAVTGGTITCDKFTDVNGKIYSDWIPAIKLWS